jgi:hypothetical protein
MQYLISNFATFTDDKGYIQENNYKNIFTCIYIYIYIYIYTHMCVCVCILPQSCYLGGQMILYTYDGGYFMQICCTVLNEKWETIQQEPHVSLYLSQIQEAFFFSKFPKLLQPTYFVCKEHKHYKENKKLCMLQYINKRYSQTLEERQIKDHGTENKESYPNSQVTYKGMHKHIFIIYVCKLFNISST